MKLMLVLAILLASTFTFAQTIQDADALFALRGEDTNNAKLAADVYGQVAANETDILSKGQAFTKQGLSLYFYGVRQTSSNAKESIHEKAYQIADQAVMFLSTEGDRFGDTPKINTAEGKTALALAHYASAINMGKWAEARGILASLGQWGNMKKHLEAVVKNDETVESYGAYRTFGRAWLKLPFTHGGSKKKSLRDLEYAYTNTYSEDFGTSKNSTTTVFYLDTLVANKVRGDKFCDAYYGFSDLNDLTDEELLELNSESLPEFKTDLKNFNDLFDFEEDVHSWADSNC
jgi:hypothetical protein